MDVVGERVRQSGARRAALSYSRRSSRSLAQRGSGSRLVRVAGVVVEVRAALRAQAGAVRAADDLVGQRQRVGVARPGATSSSSPLT